MSEHVVVTGANGFLAHHAIPVVPLPVVAWVRSRKRWAESAASRTEGSTVVEAPLDSWELVADAVPRARAILHMAAEVRHSRKGAEQTYHANVEGTRHAVRLAARQGARLVLVSTSGTVGCFREPDRTADESAPFCEETVRRWPYYHSKVESERAAAALARQLGVELVIVRIPVLLGPDDFGGRSTGHVARFMRGKLPFLVRGGIQIVDVRDVAQALATSTTIESPKPVYHLGGFAGSTAEFFGACAQFIPRQVPPHVPYPVAWGLAAGAETLAQAAGKRSPLPSPVVVEMAAHWWNVESRWASELGFAARPLEHTLRDVIGWLQSHSSS